MRYLKTEIDSKIENELLRNEGKSYEQAVDNTNTQKQYFSQQR